MSNKIEVHIRLNPMKDNRVWKYTSSRLSRIFAGKEILYENFVNILCTETNDEVYKKCLASKIQGYSNCTVFAYGQTGSGKTYTMLGDKSNGMIMFSLKDLLGRNEIKASYLEIYNEKIYDLNTGNELKIFSINNKSVINELSVISLEKMEDAANFLLKCEKNRKYGSTEFNLRSSRSHTIFQITYKYNNKEVTINLIDLAGSEKASKDESRRAEGAFINKSLLALCTVVNNLKNKKLFGFRDSKLTRILQNSLDGDTDIIALCAISPSDDCIEESISTLNFAARLTNLDLKKVNLKQVVSYSTTPENKLDLSALKIHDIDLKRGFYIEQFLKLNMTNKINKEAKIQKSRESNMTERKKVTFIDEVKVDEYDEIKIDELDENMSESEEEILNAKPFKESLISIKNKDLIQTQKTKLLLDRIDSLENMLLKMFKKNPNKNLKDIFILEKHMFNLKLKKYED